MLTKIISSGRPGPEYSGLKVAKEFNLLIGGKVEPSAFKLFPRLQEIILEFNLDIAPTIPDNNGIRVSLLYNILEADITFIYGRQKDLQCRQAETLCLKLQKTYFW